MPNLGRFNAINATLKRMGASGAPPFSTTQWQLITQNWENITTNWN